jgi:hypothetical protein
MKTHRVLLCVLVFTFAATALEGFVSGPDPNAGSTVSFLSDWAKDPNQGQWYFIQVVSRDRLHNDPNMPTSHGLPAAHVIVMPGDKPVVSGERAEVLYMTTNQGATKPAPISEFASSGLIYYATSFFYPATWGGSTYNGAWSVQFQLHGPDALPSELGYTGIPPAFAFGAGSPKPGAPQQFLISGEAGVYTTDQSNLQKNFWTYGLSGGASNVPLGAWVDFIFGIKWTPANAGHIVVWRRDQGQTYFTRVLDISGFPTLQQAAGKPLLASYFKQGYYRNPQTRTDELWIGPTARAGAFADAEQAAFNTNNAEPPPAQQPVVVNGKCGTANGALNHAAFVRGTLCAAGVASNVGAYSQVPYLFWTCAGQAGGSAGFCRTVGK